MPPSKRVPARYLKSSRSSTQSPENISLNSVETSSSSSLRGRQPSSDSRIVVGRVKAAWGVHGDVKIDLLSDAPDRFEPGNTVHVGDRTTRVQRSRRIRGGMLLKLDMVSDRNQAEQLRGREITITQDQVSPPPQGSYYHFQVLGLDVLSEDGENLGKVHEIVETGANDVYVVQLEGRRDILIPALEDVILGVDLEKGSMTVHLPEGLV